MRIAIKLAKPLRLRKLTELVTINGVSVYIHWSVFLIAGIMLLNAPHRPVLTLAALISYLTVLLVHEGGHMLAAHRMNCEVFSIELYPICGITRFQTPWSRIDHCVIAWGGVLAQAAVAIPFVLWVTLMGFTSFEPLNAVLALLGFFSLGVAAFNLIPVAPLDGSVAWDLLSALIDRKRKPRRPAIR